ncbi:MAG: Fur family transcriptional regulator [Ferrimicrobium sp.]
MTESTVDSTVGQVTWDLFHTLIRRHGLRSTNERDMIFAELADTRTSLTRMQLAARVLNRGIHAPTLYRTIDTFVRCGILQPLTTVTGDITYELLPPFSIHHHHFRCLYCGTTVPLEVDPSDELEAAMSRLQLPGIGLYHQVDIYGACSSCEPSKSQ